MGSPCSTCKRFDREVQDANVCEAFPDGIPLTIFRGGSHDAPVPGDGGLTYEPLPEFKEMMK